MLVVVDESGFYLLPARVRTYAPRGQTPRWRVFPTRDHLSVMSGITMEGHLFTMTRSDAMAGTDSVHFLKHLRAPLARNRLVVWDGAPIHRAVEVKADLPEGAAQHIHWERLPSYAPDLNPDEGAWKHLKHIELRNVCCLDLPDLYHALQLAVVRLRRQSWLVQSFFGGAGLAI